jgi:hypothetical protein
MLITWYENHTVECHQSTVLFVVDVLIPGVAPVWCFAGVVQAELIDVRNSVVQAGANLDPFTLDPCAHGLVLSRTDALRCLALIAQLAVVHVKVNILRIVVLHALTISDLPSLVVRTLG